jgi:LPXTG-site transpeptidase (sortase) family protein
MAGPSDTLNIGSLRLKKEYPIAQAQAHRPTDPLNHPEAAAAARARIAAVPSYNPLTHPDAIPATPTADLITDRSVLARRTDSMPTVTKARKLPSVVAPILTAIGIFALALLLFKAPVIISQLQYSLGQKPAQTTSDTPAADVIPSENTISIPKINVHAPVVYEPSIQEANVQHALQNGVVHYGNTAVPGQAGNVAIFGHSSNDWWEPGNYKFVFVLLDKLSPGDRLTVDYQSRRYTYEIVGSKVVEPTDVSVLNATKAPTLTLITCTPPGTSLRRLVVTAKQVDPNPADATAVATSQGSKGELSLPSSAPSFFQQVGSAWNGVVHGFKSLFGTDSSTDSTPSTESTPNQLPAIK